MRQNLGHILFGVIVAFLIVGTIFTYQVVAQSLNQLQFQAGSGYEITTGNASQNLDITTKATDGGAINIGSRQGTGIYINTANSIGIGTSAPTARLSISSSGANGIDIMQDTNSPTQSGRLFFSNQTAGQGVVIMNSGGSMEFRTGATANSSSGTSRMILNASGYLGINDTSPSYTLDVTGTAQFTQPVIVGTPTGDSHAATKSYVDSAAGGGVGSGSSGQTLRHNGSGWIANDVIYNNGTYVGIGTTNPGAKLDVSGNINAAGINGTIITVGDASITNLLSVGSGGASDGISVDGDIEITGDISIGTVNPLSPLHVQNDTDAAENLARFVNYGGQGAFLINEYRSDGGTSADPLWVLNSFSGEAIAIAPGINGGSIGTTVTYFDDNGNVGIGTTSPGYKLDVSGTGRFTQPVLVGTPTAAGHAATKSYVDSAAGSGITGSGSSGRLALWSGTSSLSSDGALTYSGSTGFKALHSLSSSSIAIGIHNTRYPYNRIDSWVSDGTGYFYGFGWKDNDGSSEKIHAFFKDTERGLYSADRLNVITFTSNEMGGTGLYPGYSIGAQILASGNSYINGGNLAIGKTSSSYTLDVAGTGSFSQPVIVGSPTAASHAATKSYVDSAITTGTGSYVLKSGDTMTGNLTIQKNTNPTLNLIAVNSGSDPATTASINITGYEGRGKGIFLTDADTSNKWFVGETYSTTGLSLGYDTTTNNQAEYPANSALFINTSRQVGIGTASPGYKLDVSGTGRFTQPVVVGSPTANDHAATKSYVDSATTGQTGWTDGGTNVYLTTTSDNVGIGTTSPQQKLEIAGSLRLTGDNLYLNGSNAYLRSESIFSFLTNGGAAQGGRMKGLMLGSSYNQTPDSGELKTSSNENLILDASGSGSILFQTNNSTKLTLTNSGDLSTSMGEGFRLFGDTNYFGSALDGIVFEMQDGNQTLGRTDGGFVFRGYTPTDGISSDWFTIRTPGNVGIGTLSPSYKLEVTGTGSFTQPVIVGTPTAATHATTKSYVDSAVSSGVSGGISGTQNYIAKFGATGNVVGNSQIFDNGTNVGIGTSSPGAKIEIYAPMSSYATAFTSPHLNLGASNTVDNDGFVGISYDTSTTANYGWSSGALRSSNGQGDFVWKFHSSSAEGAERMRLTNTGDLGIGTTSPGYKLDVSGTGRFTQPVIVGSPTADTHAATKSYVDSAASGGTLWASSGTNIYNTNSGNIGIGTSSPQAGMKIDVRSNGSTDGSSAITAYGYNGNEGMAVRGYGYATSGTGTNYGIVGLSAGSRASGINVGGHFYATGAPTNYALTTGAGNVGIGTTSPDFKLDISGNARIEGSNLLYFGGTSTGDWSSRMSHTTGGLNINTNGLVINDVGYTGTKNYLTILNNGNIGIDTTNPSYKLDVSGFGSFSTGIRIGSQSGTSGWFYYPNIISAQYNGNYTGAFVIHTNIARASNEMFKIRVNGYGYGNQKNIDFTVVGYSYSGANGSVDGQSGAVVNYSIVDNGNDGLPKYIGIDANGKVAVSFGSHTTSYYYYRVSADYWSTRINSDASSGWSIDQSTVAGFEWKDIKTMTPAITQLTTNYVGINNIAPSYILDVTGTGRFTQPVIVGTPTANDHAATKSYVDSATQGGGNSWVDKGNCSGTVAINWASGNTQHCTLTGATTFTFSGGTNGGSYKLILKQDAGGSKTVTWPGTTRWPSGSAPTLTTTGSKSDYVGFIYNGKDSTYDGVSFNANF